MSYVYILSKKRPLWSLHPLLMHITGSPRSVPDMGVQSRKWSKVDWIWSMRVRLFVRRLFSFFVCLGSQREHTQTLKALPKMSTECVFVCLSLSLPPDIGCASLNGCKWANKNNECHLPLATPIPIPISNICGWLTRPEQQ